jgi:hypothetical protein
MNGNVYSEVVPANTESFLTNRTTLLAPGTK